jgi:hypothetical protein
MVFSTRQELKNCVITKKKINSIQNLHGTPTLSDIYISHNVECDLVTS